MNLPKDPVMLLSVVNTELRDMYDSLQELCAVYEVDEKEITQTLLKIDYRYDRKKNQFI